jgi:metal-dependent amidase/aminoacylase/carboxypeptidase family protein
MYGACAHQALGATTLNVGILNGGQAANALAEHAEATLMFRLTDDPQVVLDMVSAALEGTQITTEVSETARGC